MSNIECPVCCDSIDANNKAVCLSCGGFLHKTCWEDFVKSKDTRIAGGEDPWNPSGGYLVAVQCVHCRAPAERVVKIGIATPTPTTTPAPARVSTTKDYWNRYADNPDRPCKKQGCNTILKAGNHGNYCRACHKSHRTWGERGAPRAVTLAQNANPTGRRCSKCRAPGHRRPNCPN